MWWNRVIFGCDAYHVVLWFLTYSILGWAVESIYMSICNHKMTNRGFAKGPFCPIYGVGALSAFFVLRPFSENGVLLFFMGSVLATALEYLTAILMQYVFGEIWWDYNEKPFNYKGILCLESSIAWGVYTLVLFMFLHNFVVGIVNAIPVKIGRVGGSILLFLFTADFLHAFYEEKKDDIPEQVTEIKEMLIEKFIR